MLRRTDGSGQGSPSVSLAPGSFAVSFRRHSKALTRKMPRARSAAGAGLAALQFLLRRRVSEIVSGQHEIGPDAQSLLGRRDGLVPIPHGLVCRRCCYRLRDSQVSAATPSSRLRFNPDSGRRDGSHACVLSPPFSMAFRAPAAPAAQQPPGLQVIAESNNASTRAGRLTGYAAIFASA